MRYNQYYIRENFGEKLLKAINNKYSDIPEHKRQGKFKNDYCEQASIDRTKFENRFSSWRYKNVLPEIENLIIICNVLDCDMDYFLTTQEKLKKDIAHASETTGLKYETIELLEKIKKNSIKTYTIDELLNHKDFEKLIQYIWEYTHSQNNEIIIHDIVGEKPSESYVGDKQKELMKYRVSEIFGSILDDIYTFYQEEALRKKINAILSEMRNNIESCIQGKDNKFTRKGLLKMVTSYLTKVRKLRPDYGLCKFSPEEIIDNFDNLKEKYL